MAVGAGERTERKRRSLRPYPYVMLWGIHCRPTLLTQSLFHPTRAKMALVIQRANGLSLEKVAEALSIRRNITRVCLRSIFSRTGVHRQTERVRLFLNSVAEPGVREPLRFQHGF